MLNLTVGGGGALAFGVRAPSLGLGAPKNDVILPFAFGFFAAPGELEVLALRLRDILQVNLLRRG